MINDVYGHETILFETVIMSGHIKHGSSQEFNLWCNVSEAGERLLPLCCLDFPLRYWRHLLVLADFENAAQFLRCTVSEKQKLRALFVRVYRLLLHKIAILIPVNFFYREHITHISFSCLYV